MNLGQNKFFTIFGAVIGLGTLGLGWAVYSSYSAYDEANTAFNEKKDKLNELQSLPLYPEPSNVKILKDQEKVADESVVALHEKLMPMAFPLDPLTPEQFQDQLNASVKSLVEKAAKAGVVFPEKLNLGFTEYRTSVPKPEAAAALGRQLKCIELVVSTMIDRKVASIEAITRPQLPEEAEAKAPAPSDPKQKGKGKAGGTPVPLVTKYPFTVKFAGEQQAFQDVINDLSKSTQQFYIIRNVKVENQLAKPPKRGGDAKKATPTPTPGAQPQADKLKYVLGIEKLNVTLDFDSVVFASNLPK
ncbi:MAG: Amuc_1100 family pilus-like protein [Chthoniobacteraceae bacterium]